MTLYSITANECAVWLVKPPISLAMKHKCKLALLTIPLVSVSFLSVGGAKFKIMEGCIKCECGENRFYYFGDYAVCSNCSNEFKETKTNKECVVPNGTAIMPVRELWMRRVNRKTGKYSNWEHWSGALANER
ncbi:MAG: hypothetical protein WDA02_03400 [Saccharofermentanales bacterium]